MGNRRASGAGALARTSHQGRSSLCTHLQPKGNEMLRLLAMVLLAVCSCTHPLAQGGGGATAAKPAATSAAADAGPAMPAAKPDAGATPDAGAKTAK